MFIYKKRMDRKTKAMYEKVGANPLLFIQQAFGLRPQQVLDDYKELLEECRRTGDYTRMRLRMFEPFERYKMLSWQQVEIILAVSRAIQGEDKKRIAVRSWHGIGKSSVISMIVIRYLFAFYWSVIGCTAPTATQMRDVLWKELQIWKERLPDGVKDLFERTNDYLRVWFDKEQKATRYARARTASKDQPEALAWLHADFLMIIADEASWVDDAIFETAQSAGTNKNAIFLMISNPTRLEWYFYKAFTDNAENFQTLAFNSEESALVDKDFVDWIVADYGKQSDQYRVRVLWEFPKVWLMDEKGRIPLFDPNEISFVDEGDIDFQMEDFDCLWIDPAWNGKDFSSFVARNNFYAKRVAREDKSTEKSVALKAEQVMKLLPKLTQDRVYYDNFGVGANVWVELAKEWIFAKWVNAWDKPNDTATFLNKRAECYWRLKTELRQGLRLVWDRQQWSDLYMIKYKKTEDGRIRIMSKVEMRKEFGKSPDDADALMLTFWDATRKKETQRREKVMRNVFTDEVISGTRKSLDNKTYELW